jgi:hypothetical protein
MARHDGQFGVLMYLWFMSRLIAREVFSLFFWLTIIFEDFRDGFFGVSTFS